MRLSEQDAAFLYAETASAPMHSANVAVLEGQMPFESVFDHVAERLHLMPRLRQRLAFVPLNLTHPKWVDDPDFELRRHVRLHELPPGSSLDDALAVVLELAEPLLPRDRPLWRIDVIAGVAQRTLVLQLGHQVLLDGGSGVDLSTVLFDLQKSPSPPRPPNLPWSPAPLPTPVELAAEAATYALQDLTERNPFRAQNFSAERVELLRRAGESVSRFVAEPVLTAPWNAGWVGRKRQFAWRSFPFAEFRNIRKRFGGTVNDVVLAVAVEAAVRYLRERGSVLEGQHMRVMCPVSVRRESDSGTLGSRMSAIFPVIDTDAMSVVERLQKVRWEAEHIKQNREAQALALAREAAPAVPAMLALPTLAVGTKFDPTGLAAGWQTPLPALSGVGMPLLGFNFACVNLPGVQTAQYLAGHAVLDSLALLMLGGNLGYGVAVTSYNQQLYFNLICDPQLMPDLETMATALDAAFQELSAAALEPQVAASDVVAAHTN